jgi:hypothetical protein
MTGLTPEEHFANHKAGIKAAAVVKRYGLRLFPELFMHLNPMPFEAAVAMEKDLAEDLRRAGFTVTGGLKKCDRGFRSVALSSFIGHAGSERGRFPKTKEPAAQMAAVIAGQRIEHRERRRGGHHATTTRPPVANCASAH